MSFLIAIVVVWAGLSCLALVTLAALQWLGEQ